MWIIIDEAISNISTDSQKELQGLETLLLSIARGEHALAVNFGVAKKLAMLPLSIISKATILEAGRRASEYISQSRSSRYKAYIKLDGPPITAISNYEWEISIAFLSDNGMPKSALLAENLTDAEIYQYSAYHYQALSKDKLNFKIALLGGGGADTPKTLKNEIDQKNLFVFCITDSDKLSPLDSVNQTCRACSKIINEAVWIAFHSALEEREAENHIPITLIEDTINCPQHKDSRNRFHIISDINFSEDQWKYIDLKEGTSLRKCFENKDFWSNVIQPSACTELAINICKDFLYCLSQGTQSCNCIIAPGISTKLLENVLRFLKENGIHLTANRIKTARNVKPWLETGKSICEWGAAVEKRRA